MEKKKVFIGIGIVAILIIIIVVTLKATVMKKDNNKVTNDNNIGNTEQKEEINLNEYIDESYGISFKYSKELKDKMGGSSEVNLEHPKVAGSEFFYNSPNTPNISYNKDIEIKQYIQTRASFGKSKLIKQEETTISKNNPIQCTLLEYVTGQYTEYIYIIPHRAGLIYMGITFPTGETIKEFNEIIDSIIMK
jgi:hypothetical protein